MGDTDMVTAKERFSGQAEPELLAAMRRIAQAEGRDFEAALEEAMQEYVANRGESKVRPEVMAHFRDSLEKNRLLVEQRDTSKGGSQRRVLDLSVISLASILPQKAASSPMTTLRDIISSYDRVGRSHGAM